MNELYEPMLRDTQIHSTKWWRNQREIHHLEALGWGKRK